MQVTVTGRHMTPTESTRAYAEEKFGRIAKIYDSEEMVAEVVLREPAVRVLLLQRPIHVANRRDSKSIFASYTPQF